MKLICSILCWCLCCPFGLWGQSIAAFDQQYANVLPQIGQSDTASVLAALEALEQQASAIGYQNGLSDVANARGHLYVSEGTRSVAYYIQSIEFARRGSDSSRVARGYGNLCHVFSLNENYREAIGYGTSAQHLLEHSVEVKNERIDRIRLAELYLNMSVAYGHFKEKDLALEYARRAVSMHKQTYPADTSLIIASLKSLAAWYANFSEPNGFLKDSALTCYADALAHLPPHAEHCMAPDIYLHIAAIIWDQGRPSEGWQWLAKAEQTITDCDDEYSLDDFSWNIGFQKAQWWLMEKHAAKALVLLSALYREDADYFVQQDGWAMLAETFEQLGQQDSAAFYYKRAFDRSQKTFEKEQTAFNTVTLDRLKEQGQRKLEQEANKTREAQTQNRMLLMGLIIALLLLLLLALSSYFLRKQSRLKDEQHQLKLNQLLSESETKFLEGQNEGRLSRLDQIYSMLHSEYVPDLANIKRGFESLRKKLAMGLAPYEQGNELYEQLSETTMKIRQLAQELSPHNQTTQHAVSGGLLDSIQQRVDIVNRQQQVNVLFNHTDLLINERFALDIRRIVIDLLENALKYAQATQIQIHLMQTEQRLAIQVDDNGHGLLPGAQTTGTGLANIRRKVELYNGEGPIIDSGLGQGTRIAIYFPLNQ